MMIMTVLIIILILWNELLIILAPSTERKCTTSKETEQIIKSLKTKNSYGYDEISTNILKTSSPFISSPLNYIRNKMLFWGVFPDRSKYAVIKPLHKNVDRCEVSNY